MVPPPTPSFTAWHCSHGAWPPGRRKPASGGDTAARRINQDEFG
jgi:hypothetical protein